MIRSAAGFAACPEKEDRLAASMTLGKGVDELQEKLQKQDMLLESYMVETLAGEASDGSL